MKENGSKRRFVITLASLGVAVVAVICSVVAIFAAVNQTIKPTFKVGYEAKNVAAKVSAEYTVLNEETVTVGSLTINAEDDENTVYEQLAIANEIKLTAKNKEVVFKYTFENLSEDNSIDVVLTDNASKDNVTVEYATREVVELTEGQEPAALTYAGTLDTVNVAAESAVEIFIKVTITKTANDAHYISDSTNYVQWKLTAVYPTNP